MKKLHWVVFCCALWACGGGSTGGPGLLSDVPVLPDGGALNNETFGGQTAGDGVATGGADGVVAADGLVGGSDGSTGVDGTTGSDSEPVVPDPEKPDYEACIDNTDCDSGWCVESPDGGKVCTETCIDECPLGWKCEGVTNTGGDVTFICMPRWLGLCRPCIENEDCSLKDSVCLDWGNSGRFCATACLNDTHCPKGYLCQNALCVLPADQECQCTEADIKSGAKTICKDSNEFGSCTGERVCTEDGLSACTVDTASTEVCDGQDNNCNGVVDEGTVGLPCTNKNDLGECEGVTTCEAATLGCTAATPSLELCDGIDNDCDGTIDEETGDQDGDGIADCLDDDIDGDGVANDSDNCPVVPNAEQADADADKLGDLCDDDDDNDNVSDDIDNCPNAPNFEQEDIDNDGAGDACDDDKDGDGVPNDTDNCASVVNPKQEDTDNNGVGDLCSDDKDGDGVPNSGDNCPDNSNADQTDTDGNGVGDICDDDNDGDGDPDVTDCAALNPKIHKDAQEICNGLDDNCNKIIDDPDAEGCSIYYLDGDGDGFGSNTLSKCLCNPQDKYNTVQSGDCNDGNASANPSAGEVCDNVDNNCNNEVDEQGASGCINFYVDADKDGYGKAGTQLCQCGPTTENPVKIAGDCDDKAIDVNPGADEVCGGGDENCNKQIDEQDAINCKTYYRDVDGDGWGNENQTQCLCKPGNLYIATKGGDCDDADKLTYPAAPELCDGLDNNCNKKVDEGSPKGCTTFWVDNDGDGFAADDAASACKCGPSAPYTAQKKGDCNDNATKVNPKESELCDAKDNNCNNKIDEGFSDADGDNVMDCVDTDDDNDGVIDVKDCQPFNSAIPSCAGKQCGEDGCGKSCGVCPAKGCTVPQDNCMNKLRCQSTLGAEKSSSSLWTCTGCGDVDFKGQCWADDIVVWCAEGVLTKLQCTKEKGGKCIFKNDLQWYDCVYP